MRTRRRANINNVIRRFHDLFLVLNHQYGITHIPQGFQYRDQPLRIFSGCKPILGSSKTYIEPNQTATQRSSQIDTLCDSPPDKVFDNLIQR